MNKIIPMIGLLGFLFSAAVMGVPPSTAATPQPQWWVAYITLKGTCSVMSLRRRTGWPWSRTPLSAAEDTLFSGSRGMAELIAPNGTWIRVGTHPDPGHRSRYGAVRNGRGCGYCPVLQ